MTKEPDAPADYRGLSMRISPTMQTRIERLKQKLDTQHTSEVVRRALEWYDRCVEAESVEVTVDGQRSRSVLP